MGRLGERGTGTKGGFEEETWTARECPEYGLTGGGTHGAQDEDRRRASRSPAIRGCAWEAGQRPRSAVGRRPSSARRSPAAPRSVCLRPPRPRATAADTAVSTPPGSVRGKASPRWQRSRAAAVLAQGRGAEPTPRSARRTSPFLPLSRLYATTSRPPTVPSHRPTPTLSSPPGDS